MNRTTLPSLTNGAILNIINRNALYDEKPILQILGCKNLAESAGNDRFRILLSDGKYMCSYGMLATQLNPLVADRKLEDFTIVKLLKYVINQVPQKGKDQPPRKLIIILDLQPLIPGDQVGEKIGNPQLATDHGEEEPSNQARQTTGTLMGNMNLPKTLARSNNSGACGWQAENSNIVTHPIVSLTPYQNNWTLKVRITNKSDIRTWNNSRGEGKLFSMEMMDESGEIRATAFKAECDKFYDLIEVGKVYYISQATLKVANKQYTRIKNDYEMSFTQNTTVIPCHDEASNIPCISFNFVPIDQLTRLEKNIFIDVIGVAKSASEVNSFVSKTTNKELKKRDVHLVDDTNTEVMLTIWGKASEDFDVSSQPIVALKGAKLSDYNGCSLGFVSATVMQINPDMPEAHKLRGWFDNLGSSVATTNISTARGSGIGGGDGSFKSFAEVKLDNLGSGVKPDYYTVKAMVTMINKERAIYKACPQVDCNKKVVDQDNGVYRCEKCQRDFQDYKWRLMLSVNLGDSTDQQWVTCFHEAAETLLGKKADDIGKLKESDDGGFQKVFDAATFKWYSFRLRVKMETFNDESRLKTTVYEAREINYKEYNEKLIREIQELSVHE